MAANWKIIQENFQECYHCTTIHPELVDTLPAFRTRRGAATYDTEGYVFAPDKASFSVSGSAVLPRLPGLEDRDDRKYYGMVMRPNCFLSLLPDHVIAHRFEPVSAGGHQASVCEWLFPPSTVAGYDLSDTVELFHRVNEQDFAASEWCQPNMKSRAYAAAGCWCRPSRRSSGAGTTDWYRGLMGIAGEGWRGMAQQYRVIVIGCGAVGAATAYWLSHGGSAATAAFWRSSSTSTGTPAGRPKIIRG